jgi:hypothetical protein
MFLAVDIFEKQKLLISRDAKTQNPVELRPTGSIWNADFQDGFEPPNSLSSEE